MMQIIFDVLGDPRGKGRPRFSRFGKFTKVYTDQQTFDYETAIGISASQAMGSSKPLETPLAVFLYIRLPVPPSYSKKRSEACLSGLEHPTKKPDIDNVAKTFLDAMNGIVYKDDVQVMRLVVQKVYDSHPSVVVHVKEMLK
jgi:Holliday junction resolvase RusA-like endonuclease